MDPFQADRGRGRHLPVPSQAFGTPAAAMWSCPDCSSGPFPVGVVCSVCSRHLAECPTMSTPRLRRRLTIPSMSPDFHLPSPVAGREVIIEGPGGESGSADPDSDARMAAGARPPSPLPRPIVVEAASVGLPSSPMGGDQPRSSGARELSPRAKSQQLRALLHSLLTEPCAAIAQAPYCVPMSARLSECLEFLATKNILSAPVVDAEQR